jgi:hypothetical protein
LTIVGAGTSPCCQLAAKPEGLSPTRCERPAEGNPLRSPVLTQQRHALLVCVVVDFATCVALSE